MSVTGPSRNLPSLDLEGPLGWLRKVVDPGSDRWFDFSQPNQQIILFLVVFALLTLVIHGLQRSASGRAMLATRSSEVAARTSGSFAISSCSRWKIASERSRE